MEGQEYDEKVVEAVAPSSFCKPFKEWPNDAGFNAKEEVREAIELLVNGFIPVAAAGILYRTGPASYKVTDNQGHRHKLSHWFDGFTQVHRFQLIPTSEGSCKVLYNSRQQVDKSIERFRSTGELHGITFGQKRDPCMSIFQKIKCAFEPTLSTDPNLANIGVTIYPNLPSVPSHYLREAHDDHSVGGLPQPQSLTCLTDANQAKHIDPETLEPIGVTRQEILHPELKGPLSCTHAEQDPLTGDIFNYNLEFGMKATYRVFKTSLITLKTEILATITGFDVRAAYIHSFFLSEGFVILCVWPCFIAAGGVRILWERNMMDAMYFDRDVPTKWYVVDRKHGRGHVATFESIAFFAFHTINAYQEDRDDGDIDIICDIIQFPNSDILHRFFYENLISTGSGVPNFSCKPGLQPDFARYRLAKVPKDAAQPKTSSPAPHTAEIELKVPSPAVGELPCINSQYACRKTRYLYTIVDRGFSSFFDGICKLDLETLEVKYWEYPKHTPGEAIFVSDGTDGGEDAGYLLSVVLNGETGTSYLLCLDARDMTELGRAEYAGVVGFGFHGAHLTALGFEEKE